MPTYPVVRFAAETHRVIPVETYSNSKPEPGPSLFQKVILTLFGLFFAGIGLAFLALMMVSAWQGLQTWTWPATPCQILSSSVAPSKNSHTGEFEPAITYRYSVAGKEFTSTRLSRGGSDVYTDYGKAAGVVGCYPVGLNAVCYANPNTPEIAILERFNPFVMLFIPLPVIFVALGVFVIYATWSGKFKPRSHSARNLGPPRQRFWVSFVFASIFLVMGLLGSYFFLARPLLKVHQAKSWTTVPCIIISGELVPHSSRKGGTTYSVNIFYRYEFHGQSHKANAYDFLGSSSSGTTGKRAILNRYPPHSSAVCYVNPDNPTEAVLERGFVGEMWIGVVPVVFIFIGLFGLIYVLRRNGRSANKLPETEPVSGK